LSRIKLGFSEGLFTGGVGSIMSLLNGIMYGILMSQSMIQFEKHEADFQVLTYQALID